VSRASLDQIVEQELLSRSATIVTDHLVPTCRQRIVGHLLSTLDLNAAAPDASWPRLDDPAFRTTLLQGIFATTGLADCARSIADRFEVPFNAAVSAAGYHGVKPSRLVRFVEPTLKKSWQARRPGRLFKRIPCRVFLCLDRHYNLLSSSNRESRDVNGLCHIIGELFLRKMRPMSRVTATIPAVPPLSTCLFTGKVLTPDTREEHTILWSLGGRVRSRRVTSSAFNEACGSHVDPYLLPHVRIAGVATCPETRHDLTGACQRGGVTDIYTMNR
jgi:hypothetical protein